MIVKDSKNGNQDFSNTLISIFSQFKEGITEYNKENYTIVDEKLFKATESAVNLIDHSKLKGNSISRKIHKDVLLEICNVLERNRKKYSKSMIVESGIKATKGKNLLLLDNIITKNNYVSIDTVLIEIKNLKVNSDEYFLAPIKFLASLSNGIDNGIYLNDNIYLRKELSKQGPAKIPYIYQKHEALNFIYNKIDNIATLALKGVINSSNFDRFCDTLVDIQNSFSNEIEGIVKNKHLSCSKEILQNSFQKKFDFASKYSPFESKLEHKPDYFEWISKLINKLYELSLVYSEVNKIYDNKQMLEVKKMAISHFLYAFLYKLIFNDLSSLTMRFLKKKINVSENK